MKKNYVKPSMSVEAITTSIICTSNVRTVDSGDAGIGYGGGGSGPARARGFFGEDGEDWDEE
jgi:hypothetical protein